MDSWHSPVPEKEHWDTQFDWNDIRLFVLVAQCGSFRRASSVSNKSVNVLRRRVQQLEHRMKCRLFVRDVQGSHLTERGSRLLATSQRMLDASYDVGLALRRRSQSRSHIITLGVDEGLGLYWLSPLLKSFHQSQKTIRIEIRCIQTMSQLALSKVDLLVQHEPPTQNDLVMMRLGHVHEQLFGCRGLLGKTKRSDEPDQLLALEFVERSIAPSEHAGWQQAMLEFSDRMVTVRTDAICAQYQAIGNGAGIGLLPTYLSIFDPDLVPLFEKARYRRDIYLTFSPALREQRDLRKAVEWLKASFNAKHYPWFAHEPVSVDEMRNKKAWLATSY